MIPRDHILEWREQAPWPQDVQVEQDLIISRALVAIFSNPLLHDALAFRGGTALYQFHLPAARYSEDMEHEDHKVTRAMFEENFLKKLDDPEFMADISPLLASGYEWDAEAAAPLVKSTFIERLPGEPWKNAPKKPEKEK